MSKKMSKAQSQRWHFKKAIHNRYGIFCNRRLYWYIADEIKSGNVKFLLKQSHTRALCSFVMPVDKLCDRSYVAQDMIEDGCVTLYLVYDKLRKELVTALPWYKTEKEFMEDYSTNHQYIRS